MNCKYIMLEECKPTLFPSFMGHCAIVAQMGSGKKITSAGFVTVRVSEFGTTERDIIVITYGESVGLKMKPSTDDAGIIKRMLTE